MGGKSSPQRRRSSPRRRDDKDVSAQPDRSDAARALLAVYDRRCRSSTGISSGDAAIAEPPRT
ncbi:RNA polymerase, sigma-24 subunit, RpoE domain protein [Mycobacterium xenopi 4042]|uniref:RNA polymerase, sigma-24 subunit, RpoE domain protein n=1 Tax=Mycobacterium xenopi 4042 TaxID=1299334 RepID=X7YIG0_MYCXE|nr:RNA polymerase, sigma-24 subunit, RpoE domain protein [Mycobacterium xenopi 4042]